MKKLKIILIVLFVLSLHSFNVIALSEDVYKKLNNINPTLAIVVPNYNNEKYLSMCLDSLINQTKRDIVIIIADDGSTDNSPNIIADYKSKDNRIVSINCEHKGASAARNVALEIALSFQSVEYIMFVDSDDYLELTACEKLFNRVKQDNCDILGFGFFSFPKTKPWYKICANPENKIFNPLVVSELLNSRFDSVHIWNKIYKKTVCENIRFIDKLQPGEDYCFNLQAFANSTNVEYNNIKLYHHRTDNETSIMHISNNCEEKLKNLLSALKTIIEYYRNFELLDSCKSIFLNKFLNVIWHYWDESKTIQDMTDDFLSSFGQDVFNLNEINKVSFKLQNRIFDMTNGNYGRLIEKDSYTNEIFNEIKLVIWDLDDTIWYDILSEKNDGELKLFPFIENTIKSLNKRGIINSICSKNDFILAKNKLMQLRLWDEFVFPSINYLPKGQRISEIIFNMNLQPQNVLFIDDDETNLEEAKFYNKGINTINSKFVESILENKYLLGKDDSKLKRLQYYRQLEKRHELKKLQISNEEFLKCLDIEIEFLKCNNEILDRIYEMVQRTNQLNFTKNRATKEELKRLINDPDCDCRCIKVKDKFGDNGIVGFYAIKENKLIHFLFSCRIMNLNVEKWVWAYLGYPKLAVVGETAVDLDKNIKIPDYIKLKQNSITNNYLEDIGNFLDRSQKVNIYTFGACDLKNLVRHLNMPNQDVTYNFREKNNKTWTSFVGTEYLRNCLEMKDSEKQFALNNYFPSNSEIFKTKLFDKKYDYAIFSFMDDMRFKIHKHKYNSNLSIYRIMNLAWHSNDPFNPKLWLKGDFEQGNFITAERFRENLNWIRNKLSPETIMIILGGPSIVKYFTYYGNVDEKVWEQIKVLNNEIFNFAKETPNVIAVDLDEFVTSRDCVTDNLFHFTAQTSYKIVCKILELMAKSNFHNKRILANLPINNREILVIGSEISAMNVFYNLSICGEHPNIFILCRENEQDLKKLISKNKYYLIFSDDKNYDETKNIVCQLGYEPVKDFVKFKASDYENNFKEYRTDKFFHKKDVHVEELIDQK